MGARYKIQPGDFLLITFLGEPDYTQQVRVDGDGQIRLPSFGSAGKSDIQAAGVSTSELAEKIDRYAEANKLLQNARAQVVVTEYSTKTFVLLGQVNQPGRYSFPRGVEARIDLNDAIALGGGYTRLARQSLVIVKRGTQVFKVDLRGLTTRPGPGSFAIYPGDVITVAERFF